MFQFEWVQQHLGRGWVNRLVITKDKTIVTGDLLIDDRPKIKGSHFLLQYNNIWS